METPQEIPGPPGMPFVGNVFDIQDEIPIRGIERLIDLYGPIVKFSAFGEENIVIGNVALLEELSDEKRFWKSPARSLTRNRNGKRGLFSSESEDEPDWQQAHRVLMPAFGPLAVGQMFDEMYDIATQLVLKIARLGPSYSIDATSDFTRLTLDTIALCAMDYRFNSFYQDELHPFVKAMNNSLSTSSDSGKIHAMLTRMLPWDKTLERAKMDRAFMAVTGRGIVESRKRNPTEKQDMLNTMIYSKDPQTNLCMSSELISANMVTFLIAGHETTSGILSFAFLLLLQHPEAYFRAQKEVDEVVGRRRLKLADLDRLQYIDAVLRETLRLHPTAPAFVRSIRSDNSNDVEYLDSGRFAIRRQDRVLCPIGKIQRDVAVWGADADEFRPERMLSKDVDALPRSAWKPFGTGVRSCIGRAFAWQEAKITVALLLQNFNFRLEDSAYQLKIKQALTVKPVGFRMRASLRGTATALDLQTSLMFNPSIPKEAVDYTRASAVLSDDPSSAARLTVLYGSNAGTCRSLAQRLCTFAGRRGLGAVIKTMDEVIEALPKSQLLVVIAPSYEGQAPQNGAHFVAWLEKAAPQGSLDGVHYAVFGCGHSDWKTTFQRIPTLVDYEMARLGGDRIAERGSTDAAQNHIMVDFDKWASEVLFPALTKHVEIQDPSSRTVRHGLVVQTSTHSRAAILQQSGSYAATVVVSRAVTAPGQPVKRHLELRLPPDVTYKTGDYLTILPLQPHERVQNVCRRFGISEDTIVTILSETATFLPTGQSISVGDILRGYVELGQPASETDLEACILPCQENDAALYAELKTRIPSFVEQRVSPLDFLTRRPSIKMPFDEFLAILPPLRPRFYSISSSCLIDPQRVTITYGVEEQAMTGPEKSTHTPVAGAYMAHLQPDDVVSVTVREPYKAFRLPADMESTPVIMFCAGTGLAPFRAFVEERVTLLSTNRPLARAILFIGCRSQTEDRLYAEELDQWAAAGAVDLRYAFSQEPRLSLGCKHIQDRIWLDRDDIRRAWQQGAKVLTCGAPSVAAEIRKVAVRILREDVEQSHAGSTMSEDEAQQWFHDRQQDRIVVDTFV